MTASLLTTEELCWPASQLLAVAVLLNLVWGLAVNSWPGLCTILVQCIAKELGTSSGKKRGPDATVSKTFRRFVQTADDERRSGLYITLFEHGLAHTVYESTLAMQVKDATRMQCTMQEGVACWGAEQPNYLRMSKTSSTGPAQPPQSAQTTAVFCVRTCWQMRTIAPWFLPARSRVTGPHDHVSCTCFD